MEGNGRKKVSSRVTSGRPAPLQSAAVSTAPMPARRPSHELQAEETRVPSSTVADGVEESVSFSFLVLSVRT